MGAARLSEPFGPEPIRNELLELQLLKDAHLPQERTSAARRTNDTRFSGLRVAR
jgi:hypothetical protein